MFLLLSILLSLLFSLMSASKANGLGERQQPGIFVAVAVAAAVAAAVVFVSIEGKLNLKRKLAFGAVAVTSGDSEAFYSNH